MFAAALACAFVGVPSAWALPPGFQETTAFSGLTQLTVVRFAADGRILVAEKSGLIEMFSGLGDTAPDTVADLRIETQAVRRLKAAKPGLQPRVTATFRASSRN